MKGKFYFYSETLTMPAVGSDATFKFFPEFRFFHHQNPIFKAFHHDPLFINYMAFIFSVQILVSSLGESVKPKKR